MCKNELFIGWINCQTRASSRIGDDFFFIQVGVLESIRKMYCKRVVKGALTDRPVTIVLGAKLFHAMFL